MTTGFRLSEVPVRNEGFVAFYSLPCEQVNVGIRRPKVPVDSNQVYAAGSLHGAAYF